MWLLLGATALAGPSGSMQSVGLGFDGATLSTDAEQRFDLQSLVGSYRAFVGRSIGFVGSFRFGGVLAGQQNREPSDLSATYTKALTGDLRLQLAYSSPLDGDWVIQAGAGWHTRLTTLRADGLVPWTHFVGGLGVEVAGYRLLGGRTSLGLELYADVDFLDFHNGGDLRVAGAYGAVLSVAFRLGGR